MSSSQKNRLRLLRWYSWLRSHLQCLGRFAMVIGAALFAGLGLALRVGFLPSDFIALGAIISVGFLALGLISFGLALRHS